MDNKPLAGEFAGQVINRHEALAALGVIQPAAGEFAGQVINRHLWQ